jgi:HK97 family phage portal protein
MPGWMQRLWDRGSQKQAERVNLYEGFQADGAIILRDQRGTRKAEIPDVDLKSDFGLDPLSIYKPSGSKNVDAAKAMTAFTGWAYAAVNAIASEIANIQWRLYQVKGKEHVEVIDHPLLDLLDGVNENMTGIELKYLTAAHLELTGNAYWLMDGVSSPMGMPRAIHPLNPGRVRLKINKGSFPFTIGHYEYTIEGKVYTFQPHQIVHLKYPDPNDPFVGIGIPQTIASWIDSDNYAMDYNRKFFINGAQVGLYIQTDTNVEGNLDRIRRSFADKNSGSANAHKTPVLPKGVKLEHTGVTHKDMDFGNLAEATRDRILAAFRVSKTILGTAESDTNRSTAETADYVFSKRTIKPKMLLIVSYLNEYLVPRYGEDLYLTFLDPVPEDRAARAEEMKASLGGMPVMTQNEARRAYMGLGPVDGGDQLMVPSTMVSAGTTASPEGEDQTPQLARAVTASGHFTSAVRIRTGGKTEHSGSHAMRSALSEAFKGIFDKKMAVEYSVKSITELTHDEYMEHWKRFADRSGKANADLRDAFKRINDEQKAVVLRNLPDATGVTKSLDELFDVKEWIGITIDFVSPILLSLAKDEAIGPRSSIRS